MGDHKAYPAVDHMYAKVRMTGEPPNIPHCIFHRFNLKAVGKKSRQEEK